MELASIPESEIWQESDSEMPPEPAPLKAYGNNKNHWKELFRRVLRGVLYMSLGLNVSSI